MQSKGHFIGGGWQVAGGESFQSTNPASGELLFEGSEAGQAEVDAAVQHAQKAFATWSKTGFEERLAIIEKFKAIAEERVDVMAEAIASETGKAMWESAGEAKGVAAKVDISINAYHERTGTNESQGSGLTNKLQHRPHGVMAVYGPYNFPAHLPNGHIIPALLAGNVVVFKPSELTPYVGQLMTEWWEEAGIPAGVVQLVQGAKTTGIALSKHEGLNGILFTGSVATGTALHKQCAGRLDMVLALELGGHNPLVVWDAGDVDAAVAMIIQSAFVTTGQRCTCARRLVVQNSSASETLLRRLVDATKQIVIGAWNSEPAPFIGPLISAHAANQGVVAYKQLIENGATSLLEMTQPQKDSGSAAFVTPAIVDVTNMASAPDEEIFAPLLKVTRVDSFEAAIVEANNTRYGLSAGILSDDQAHIDQFMRDIKAGIIAVNRPTTGASGAMPFGGIGVSGNHQASAYYAADYCAYPMAAQMTDALAMPASLPPGLKV